MGRASTSVVVLGLVLSASGVSWWDRVTGGTAAGTAAGFVGGDPGQPPPLGPGLPQLRHNPGDLFFTTAAGDEVYLRGSHTWPSVQDYQASGPFDFEAFLFLQQSIGANSTRLWAWDAAHSDGAGGPLSPMPFVQVSPGVYDVMQINPAYIARLVERVDAAGEAGLYVSVMIGQGWTVHQDAAWADHPFNAGNNVNGIASNPAEVQSLSNPKIVAAYELLARAVVEAVAGRSHVLFEVGNEFDNNPAAWAFQNHLANYIKSIDPHDRPVGITAANWWSGDQADIPVELAAGPADWVSPDGYGHAGGFQSNNPVAATGDKVSMADTDHIWGIGGDEGFVWSAFTRGYNVWNMDSLSNTGIAGIHPGIGPGLPTEAAVREGIRQTGLAADMVNLNDVRVLSARSSEGFLLGNLSTGNLIGYDPNGGSVTLDLTGVSGNLDVFWFDLDTGVMTQGTAVAGGAGRTLTAPSPGPQGFVLVADGSTPPPPPLPRPPRPTAGATRQGLAQPR
jgi:hypothetical protein